MSVRPLSFWGIFFCAAGFLREGTKSFISSYSPRGCGRTASPNETTSAAIDSGRKVCYNGGAFLIGEKQMYSLSENNIREVNTKPVYDNLQPFHPDYVDSISTDDVFYYVGRKVGRCADNKLKVCKVFMLGFEYEGCTFSFPFLLDKSLDKPAILGKESLNHITKTVMKHKAET